MIDDSRNGTSERCELASEFDKQEGHRAVQVGTSTKACGPVRLSWRLRRA